MKQLTAILAAVAILLGGQAEAQDGAFANGRYSHTFYGYTGYANYDLAKLNVLLPNNVSSPGNHFSGIGIGGQHQINGFIVGLSGERFQTVDRIPLVYDKGEDNEPYSVDGKSLKGMITTGYAVIDQPNIRVFPMIGGGLQRFSLELERNEDITPSQIQNNEMQGTEYNFDQKNFVAEASIGVDYIFGKTEDDKTKGPMLGFRAGYHFAVPNSSWDHGGGSIDQAPDFGTKGFFGKVVLGFGGTSKTMPQCDKWKKHKAADDE